MTETLGTLTENALNVAPFWVWVLLIIGGLLVVKTLWNGSLNAVGYP